MKRMCSGCGMSIEGKRVCELCASMASIPLPITRKVPTFIKSTRNSSWSDGEFAE